MLVLAIAGIYFFSTQKPVSLSQDPEFLKIKQAFQKNGYSFASLYDLNLTIDNIAGEKPKLASLQKDLNSMEFSGKNKELLRELTDYFIELTDLRLNEALGIESLNSYTKNDEEICYYLEELIELEIDLDLLLVKANSLNREKEKLIQNEEINKLDILREIETGNFEFVISEFTYFNQLALGICGAISIEIEDLNASGGFE